MKDAQIKLNDIVTAHEIKLRNNGPMHTLSNSLKRNTMYGSLPSQRKEESYESKLPNISFTRRDLSLILRYILYKQQMQLADRNLLRRILVTIFDEQLNSAGSKMFIHHLKILETKEDIISNPIQKKLYFVLKGRVLITTEGVTYEIKQGSVFGDIELLSNISIDQIEFTSKHLILTLQEMFFNKYFRQYFLRIQRQRQMQTQCIKQKFLNKISIINRGLFMKQIAYRTFDVGETIVLAGDSADTIYFLGSGWSGQHSNNLMNKCLGLRQLVKQKMIYLQTVQCSQRKRTIPCVSRQIFINYIVNTLTMSELQTNKSELIKSAGRLFLNQQSLQKQKGISFMRVRRVKLQLNKSRLKTQPNQSFQASFRFVKPDKLLSLWKQKHNKNNLISNQKQNRSFLVK